MPGTDPQGNQKHWINGLPMKGLKKVGNDSGSEKFWRDGAPASFLFPSGTGVATLPEPTGGLLRVTSGPTSAQGASLRQDGGPAPPAGARLRVDAGPAPPQGARIRFESAPARAQGASLRQTFGPAPPAGARIRTPPAPVSKACGCQLSSSPTTFLTDSDVHQVPSIAKPDYQVPIVDQVFGSTLTRLTDITHIANTTVTPNQRKGLRHEYVKLPAVNANNTLMALEVHGGADRGQIQVRRISDDTVLRIIPRDGIDTEVNFHPTDPQLIFYRNGNQAIRYHVDTGVSDVLATFSAYTVVSAGQEGRPSHDWRYVGFMGQRAGHSGFDQLFCYDLVAQVQLGLRPSSQRHFTVGSIVGTWPSVQSYGPVEAVTGLTSGATGKLFGISGTTFTLHMDDGSVPFQNGETIRGAVSLATAVIQTAPVSDDDYPNWLGMSPFGTYVIAQWADYRGTRLYDRTFAFVRQLEAGYTHADVGVDEAGDEWYVYYAVQGVETAEFNPNDAGIAAVRLRDGFRKMLLYNSFHWGVHISGIASMARRGWFLISTINYENEAQTPFGREVFWIHVADAAVKRIGHHHSDQGLNTAATNGKSSNFLDYFGEVHGFPSWDGNQAFFASHFGNLGRLMSISAVPLDANRSTVTAVLAGHGYLTGQTLEVWHASDYRFIRGGGGGSTREFVITKLDNDTFTWICGSAGEPASFTLSGQTAYAEGPKYEFYRITGTFWPGEVSKGVPTGALLRAEPAVTRAEGARLKVEAAATRAQGADLRRDVTLLPAQGARLSVSAGPSKGQGVALRQDQATTSPEGARLMVPAGPSKSQGVALRQNQATVKQEGALLRVDRTSSPPQGARLAVAGVRTSPCGAGLTGGAGTLSPPTGGRLRTSPEIGLACGCSLGGAVFAPEVLDVARFPVLVEDKVNFQLQIEDVVRLEIGREDTVIKTTQ